MYPSATEKARFSAQDSVILDANGYGVITLTPHGTQWEIDSMRVFVTPLSGNPQTFEATVNVYQGFLSLGNAVDGTSSGSTGDTSDTVHYLDDGQSLIVEWTGGDPGAQATVVVRGWRYLPGTGFRSVR